MDLVYAKNPQSKTANILVLMTLASALFTIISWLFFPDRFVKLHGQRISMQFNTALCFAFSSLGMFFAFQGKRLTSFIFLILSALISWITILEYLFHWKNGINQIFVSSSAIGFLSSPGRMAPDTAFCFVFLALATLILIKRPQKTWLTFIAALLYGATIVPGFYALLGYYVKIYAYYGWGAYARMAPQTAWSFLILGVAGVIYIHQLILKHAKKRILKSALYAQLFFIGLAGVVTHVMLQYQVSQFRNYNEESAINISEQIRRGFTERSRTLQRMALRLGSLSTKQMKELWPEDAKNHLSDYKDMESLLVVDLQMNITHASYQNATSRGSSSLEILQKVSKDIEQAHLSKNQIMSTVYFSQFSGHTFSSIHPIYNEKKSIQGYLLGNFKLNLFIENLVNFEQHAFKLMDQNTTVFSNYDPKISVFLKTWEVPGKIKINNLVWMFKVQPLLDTFREHSNLLPMVVYLIGLIFAFMLSIISHQAIMATDQNQETLKLNEKLNDNHIFLNTVIDALPVTLFCKDVEKNYSFTMWNKYCEELLGLNADQVLGKSDYDFFPQEQADFFRKKDLETMAQKRIIDIPEEKIQTTSKGERLLHTMKVPIYDSNGNPKFLLGISEDITQKVSDKQLLEEQRIKLLHAEKMTSLGEVAGGIAHEINNPLAIIQGRVEQLKRYAENDLLDKERVITTTDSVINTIKRVTKIIRGLRNFARDAEHDDFEPAKVAEVVSETVDFCRTRFNNHGVELEVEEIDPTIFINCRSVQISQVILNLLNNAFDAIEGKADPYVKIKVVSHDNTVDIRIIDSGLGISRDVAEKIMLPFFTTKEVGKGTGLGLSISSAIIQTHKGRLYVDHSQSNTTFVIELPKSMPKV